MSIDAMCLPYSSMGRSAIERPEPAWGSLPTASIIWTETPVNKPQNSASQRDSGKWPDRWTVWIDLILQQFLPAADSGRFTVRGSDVP